MNGFDITLVGMRGGRDARVLTRTQSCGKTRAMTLGIGVADKFRCIVGLPGQIAQRNAVAIQMLLDAGGEDGTGGSTAALREGPEQQATAHLAGGVLDQR